MSLQKLVFSNCGDLLSQWSDSKSLNSFGTAMCNKNSRDLLLGVFDENTLLITKQFTKLVWILPRCTSLKNLTYSAKYFAEGNRIQECLTTSNITHLTISNCTAQALPPSFLVNVINSCPKLTSLSIQDVSSLTDHVLQQINPSVFNQLTELILKDCSVSVTDISVCHIASQCSNLTSFHCSYKSQSIRDDDFIQIIQANKNLRRFSLAHIGCRFHVSTSPTSVSQKSGAAKLSKSEKVIKDRLLHAISLNCPDLAKVNYARDLY
jgi:hypothetical protein